MSANLADMKKHQRPARLRFLILQDQSGTAVVEAAICIPIVIILMVGALSYGMWFMAAHSIQQSANEAARAAVAGLDAADRDTIVGQTIQEGVLHAGTVRAEHVEWATRLDGNRFTVSVTYDISRNPLLTSSLVPMPEGAIVRSASVHLSSI